MVAAHIVSIQVALPRTYGSAAAADPHDQLWTTGFFKQPVSGPVFVSRMNLAGDGQADLEHHGGVDKAVLAYSADHYPQWQEELNDPALPFGGFGENLTITGLDEHSVCIGDTWQAGEVVFQVSQPRQPCWKLSRRWRTGDLAARVIANGRSGWYLRVLTEGVISSGCAISLVERPHPEWTVARASDVMHHQKRNVRLRAELASLPLLSASWQTTLAKQKA